MLKVQRFIFSPFSENTYIIFDEQTLEAAIIDPGCYDENENNIVIKFIADRKLNLKFMINTHCHIDHIFGNAYIKKKYNPKFLASEKDIFLFDLMVDQAKVYGVELKPSPMPDEMINNQTMLTIGNSKCNFIFTPGHTPGEYCIYFEKEKICFTGDVLFNESIGRTDLWGGDYQTLIDSVKNKLFVLPDDVVIYPGHESFSTIGFEKKNNPFFQND